MEEYSIAKQKNENAYLYEHRLSTYLIFETNEANSASKQKLFTPSTAPQAAFIPLRTPALRVRNIQIKMKLIARQTKTFHAVKSASYSFSYVLFALTEIMTKL
eukprot:GEMP01074075.1.p1 GENE.GEMP01074075.1~~GEMP01074075.1.p1  ORF type:complete len:103 (-),score=3.47 GEMP01074075.1:572-880(-)